ncbi:MAG: hypothetical protein Q7T82_00975 [Armatimonadota bacterium]|nr:hypothetical protein [Armatimonadota bacterium]
MPRTFRKPSPIVTLAVLLVFSAGAWAERDVSGSRTDWGTKEQRARVAREGVITTPRVAARSRQLWRTAARINAELANLKKVILSRGDPTDYKIFISGPDADSESTMPIRTLLKKVDGAYYLFAANVENRKHSVRIEMPERIGGIRDLKALIESNGTASAAGRSITDTFEPLDVRLYQFRAD